MTPQAKQHRRANWQVILADSRHPILQQNITTEEQSGKGRITYNTTKKPHCVYRKIAICTEAISY